MELHTLVYTDTSKGFEATSVQNFTTHTEAANAMVESIRKIYPDYQCVDGKNGDETNIDDLRVGAYYAYDTGYAHNWVIISNRLSPAPVKAAPLKKYNVELTCIYNGTLRVEAETEIEAIQKANEALNSENLKAFPDEIDIPNGYFSFGEATADYAYLATE